MKNLFIITLVILISTQIYSQTFQSYGFKAGYVNSGQTHTSILRDYTTRKSGFSVSTFVNLFDYHGFSVSPEIKYIQKGMGIEMTLMNEYAEPIGKKTMYVNHHYLSIPVSIVYKIQSTAGTPFLKAAPRYDILMSTKDEWNSPSSTYEDYKNVFGGTFSVGFIPNLNPGFKPFIELSYHMDFTDTYKGPSTKITNNAVEVCIGLEI